MTQISSLVDEEEPIPIDIEILVDPPRLSTIQQGNDTLHIEYPPRLSLRWMMPIDQIEDYYYRNRAVGYVFTTSEHVPQVLLAAEMAAWEHCGVVCIQEGLVNKEYVKQARILRKQLDSKNFYAQAVSLRPVNDRLEDAGAQIKIAGIARKLSGYESKTQKRVSPASVTTFVDQFPAELQDAVLDWLGYIEFIRPEDELRKLIPNVAHSLPPACRTIGISPLGAPTDSAFRVSYNLRGLLESPEGHVTAKHLPLTEALGQKLDAYLVFDDNTNSGHQALNIFASWLEKTLPEDLHLREEHVQPLSQDLRTELLDKPLFLLFSVATEGALDRLREKLVQHCGLVKERVQCKAGRELEATDRIFSSEADFQHDCKKKLREFVAAVADAIFLSEGKGPDVAKSRALGGNDAQAMIVFPYNCPTMTIPALWLSGEYNGRKWLPLVERGRRTGSAGTLIGEDG